MLKRFFKSILDMLWTPFNRDALWNLCITEEYCTWRPWLAKVGMTFCHVNDDTQKHQEKNKTCLYVKEVLDSHKLMLEVKKCIMHEAPIIVELSKPADLKAGDVFNVWGQYRLCENTRHNGRSYIYAA